MQTISQLSLFGQPNQRFADVQTGSLPGAELLPGSVNRSASVSPSHRSCRLMDEQGLVLFTGQGSPRNALEQAFRQNSFLSGLQLPATNLADATLVGSTRLLLVRANLSGSRLTGTRIWADLSNAQLDKVEASGCNFRGSRFAGCTFANSNLSKAELQAACFRGSDLIRCNLTEASLRLADLSGCNLSGSRLYGCDVSGSDLRGVNLSGTDVRGVYWAGCSVSLAALKRSRLTPIRQRVCNLIGAYPGVVDPWLRQLRQGEWSADVQPNLSAFLSESLQTRVGAGWQGTVGSTEWIVWQFVRSIQRGETPKTSAVAYLLYQWLILS